MSRFKGKFIPYGPKETFSWSYSRLRDYLSCPRKYHEVTVQKRFSEPATKEQATGDNLHAAMKRRVEQAMPLPTAFKDLSDWGDEAAKIIHPFQVTVCEKEVALTRDLKVTGYFDGNVWFRAKLDWLTIYPKSKTEDIGRVIDYKTGKPSDDIIQLAIYAQTVFSMFPKVIAVRAEYWWTQIKDKTHDIFLREDMAQLWEELTPSLQSMEQAHKDNNFPPKRNGLCKAHCPVWTCEFNGRKQ